MCGKLGVSRSSYYRWQGASDMPTIIRYRELTEQVKSAFDASDGIFGHRMVQAKLTTAGLRCRELHRAEVFSAQTDQGCIMRVFVCIYSRDNFCHGRLPILPRCLQLKGDDQAGRQDVDETTGRAQAPIWSCLLDRHPGWASRRTARSNSRQTPQRAVSPI